MSKGSHYSCALDVIGMGRFCEDAAAKLYEYSLNENCDILLMYTGLSGIATATVLAHVLCREYNIVAHMICVRKEGDNNHNFSAVEMSKCSTKGNKLALFFVDDLVESGDTRERTLQFALLNIDSMLRLKDYVNASYVGNVLIEDRAVVEFPDKLAQYT